MPSRAPRVPSIGLLSRRPRTSGQPISSFLDLLPLRPGCLGRRDLALVVLHGQELVQWWVQQPHGHGAPVHLAQDPLEVAALERLELSERGPERALGLLAARIGGLV